MFDGRIAPARSAADLASVVGLLRAYAVALDVDLAYQGFEAELAAMPGAYAPPGGEVLLARDAAGAAVGCVALRPLAGALAADGLGGAPEMAGCEMKRLYVAPRGRGGGLGRALIEAALAAAGRIGYREVRLDTLPSMTGAVALYRATGFAPTAPYYDAPVPGTLFLRRALASGEPRGEPVPTRAARSA